jgi:hypothetical protein
MGTIESEFSDSAEARIYECWHQIREHEPERVAFVRLPVPLGLDVEDLMTKVLPNRPEVESVYLTARDQLGASIWTVFFHPFNDLEAEHAAPV